MRQITAEGIRYVYLTSVAEIPLAARAYSFGHDLVHPPPPEAYELIAPLAHVRPILVPHWSKSSAPEWLLCFARWPVGRELALLDAKVAEGIEDHSEDFVDAVMTNHLRAQCMLGCRSFWHVLHTRFDPYPGMSWERLREKAQGVSSWPCPHCQASLRLFVTDILAPG